MEIKFIYPISKSERDAHFIATGELSPHYHEWTVDVNMWTELQRTAVQRLASVTYRTLDESLIALYIDIRHPMMASETISTACPSSADEIPDAIADLLCQYDEYRAQQKEKKAVEVKAQSTIKSKVKGWLGLDLPTPD